MLPRYVQALASIALLQVFCLGITPRSEARNLTDVLTEGFSFRAPGRDTTLAAREFAPAFSASVAQAVAQQLPLAAVGPAVTFSYDFTVGIYRRSTVVPGPLFSERALTLGKGKFNIILGYSFVDFRELNGTALDHIRSPGLFNTALFNERIPVEVLPNGQTVFEAPTLGSELRTRLDLQAHLVVPTLRYGITNNWDVSVSVPIVHTSLRVRNDLVPVVEESSQAVFRFRVDAEGNIVPDEQGRLGDFVDPTTNQRVSVEELRFVRVQRNIRNLRRKADSATGIGDIILRTKYRFWHNGRGGGAAGLDLQVPSGNEKDFHGTGETRVSSFLFFSQVFWERFEPRLNVGTEFNADDVDRSSFLYTVGATLLVGKKLGVTVDLIGRSEFGKLSVRVPENGIFDEFVLDKNPDACTQAQPCSIASTIRAPFFPEAVKRNDIIDFSFGLRYALRGSSSLFFGFIVPLNDDGFRADFIPTGGLEYTF